jgi:hypothetical protein
MTKKSKKVNPKLEPRKNNNLYSYGKPIITNNLTTEYLPALHFLSLHLSIFISSSLITNSILLYPLFFLSYQAKQATVWWVAFFPY